MIRHYLQFNNFGPSLPCHFKEDLFEPHVYSIFQDGTPVFRAPDYMVFARIHGIVVGLKLAPHEMIILQAAI
jgi:hypothetical protein